MFLDGVCLTKSDSSSGFLVVLLQICVLRKVLPGSFLGLISCTDSIIANLWSSPVSVIVIVHSLTNGSIVYFPRLNFRHRLDDSGLPVIFSLCTFNWCSINGLMRLYVTKRGLNHSKLAMVTSLYTSSSKLSNAFTLQSADSITANLRWSIVVTPLNVNSPMPLH